MLDLKGINVALIDAETACIRIDAASGDQHEFKVQLADLAGLAQFLVRRVNAIAREASGVRDQDVEVNADRITATGCEVNHDLLGESVFLRIDDQFGQIAWRLKPGLASTMSKELQTRVELLRDSKTRPN